METMFEVNTCIGTHILVYISIYPWRLCTHQTREEEVPLTADKFPPVFAADWPPTLGQSLAARGYECPMVESYSEASSCFVEISASPSHISLNARFTHSQFGSPKYSMSIASKAKQCGIFWFVTIHNKNLHKTETFSNVFWTEKNR